MNDNELMRGNLVYADGEVCRIQSIGHGEWVGVWNFSKLDTENLLLHELSSIPITDELLEKNGFNRIDEGRFIIHIGDCNLYLINLLGIRENLKTDLWRIDLAGKFLSSFLNRGVLETNALHQLQNLLNIMGVEMEWKV